MELSQAIDLASAFVLPGLVSDEASLQAERMKNEDAIKTLMDAWRSAPAGKEPFGFDLVLSLVDRNRDVCDRIGAEKLRDTSPSALARKLPDADLVHAVAAMQRRPDAEVVAIAGPGLEDLIIAYVDAPVSGMVMGIDIETTDRDPARGYVVNIGLEFMDLAAKAKPHDAFAGYCGIPSMYAEKGVPLEFIHHITWDDLKDSKPLRANAAMQKALLAAMCAYPFMAHNAAFEDSWFMLNIAGYAEARKAGKICVIDSRDICRRVDPEVRILPRESRPATLENWARRRGTLAADESEVHLGLDDVELMLRTVQAEFAERNMF